MPAYRACTWDEKLANNGSFQIKLAATDAGEDAGNMVDVLGQLGNDGAICELLEGVVS